ncbi:general secretion pathway protein I [Acidovorax sp. 107]|uniref:type IV pilus modification PilV family protein n=1 Tax=Acidovorax sp. 107 TaxID=2135638 RepID=UPI000D3571DC|nr:type II secretion system protein [Acidovorax sp. 107]PUA98802.1 general secretion pathway protein I [Acidovorax sp. 107]
MTRAVRWGRETGMSLLEVLVAFSIMAMALGVLYRATGGSVRSVSTIEATQRAASLAQSLLTLRDAVPAVGWADTGETAGFAWSIHSTPYPTDVAHANVPPLHEVTVEIQWTDAGVGRTLRVVTLRPERKPLPGGTSP